MRYAIGLMAALACVTTGSMAAQAQTAWRPQDVEIDNLAWLTGHWRRQSPALAGGRIRWSEEMWMGPEGGMMLGVGRSGTTGERIDFEYLRIAAGPDRRLAYFASPRGAVPAVRFDLVAANRSSVTFENRTHDYPQRISYRREGNTLHASISLADGSREQSWTWRLRRP